MKLKTSALLVAFAAAALGCEKDKPAPVPDAPVVKEAKPYKIQLAIQGLATFSPKSDGMYVLLGNTADVSQLTYKTDPNIPASAETIAPHKSMLLFPSTVEAGTTITAARATTPEIPCKPENHEHPSGDPWQAISVAGQHLSLAGDLQPAVLPYSGGATGNAPCKPGTADCDEAASASQAADFRWMRNLTDILRTAGAEGGFRPDLYDPSYKPAGYPLLEARLFLDKGVVKTSLLHWNADRNEYVLYSMGPDAPDFGSRALALQAVVELDARGPVTLQARPLDDAGVAQTPILTIDSEGSPVRLLLANDPLDCHGNTVDWIMSFNYLANPVTKAPRPVRTSPGGGPNPRGSCSPNSGY